MLGVHIMSENKKDDVKLEITQDKLVDLLLHAATREDIALLRQETKEDNNKLINQMDVLRQETKADNALLRQETKAENTLLRQEFKEAFLELKRSNDALETRMDRQFLKIDQRYNWIIGVVIGTGVTVIGVITTLIGFIIKFH